MKENQNIRELTYNNIGQRRKFKLKISERKMGERYK